MFPFDAVRRIYQTPLQLSNRSAKFAFARCPSSNFSELGLASGAGLARELTQVVAELIFNIPRLVIFTAKAARSPSPLVVDTNAESRCDRQLKR